MTLFQKFGWHTPLADYLARLPASYPDSTAGNFKSALWSYGLDHDCVATCAILVGDLRQAVASAKECVRASMDHFMGEWRRGLAIQSNQSRWNPHDWFSNAPDALFWASVIGDWKAIEALSRFPCVPPKWACPDHAYFSLLGYFLRGESLDTHQHTVGFILTKKKQQPRLLLECLSALSALNASRFQNAWETYLDYYLKHERNKRQLNLLQSRNASFYAAAALHYGVQLEIPTRYTDYVVESLHD